MFGETCNRTVRRPTVWACAPPSTLRSVADFTDDAVLVKALAASDQDAFAYLLDRYHPSLLRLAQQYVPSRAVAEEVVQETWLAVIEGIDRFEQRSSVKTWLFRILINVARSRGVQERRSITFATNTTLDDEPSVDPRRFRRLGPSRVVSGSDHRIRGEIPNNAHSTPKRSQRSVGPSINFHRTNARS